MCFSELLRTHTARRSPCFLGIFFGANNVQNLKRPNKSIPLGAFGAISTSLILYTTILCLLAAVADRETLKTNPLLFCDCAWPSRWVAISGLLVVGLGGVCIVPIATHGVPFTWARWCVCHVSNACTGRRNHV